MQYQDREIPAYWIVEPQVQEIMVLTSIETGCREQVYQGSDKVKFQDTMLNLTAAEILSAG
jgi:Uma2 family endonuclease